MKNEKDNLEFQLSQLLDGELKGKQERRLTELLGQDKELARELGLYQQLDGRLEELGKGEQFEKFELDNQCRDIMAALERKALVRQRPQRAFFLRPVFGGLVAVAAALVLAVGLALHYLPRGGTGGPIAGNKPDTGTVSMAMVPVAPRAQGGVVSVQLERLDVDMGEAAAGGDAGSTGTVLFSSSPTVTNGNGGGADAGMMMFLD